MVKPKIKKYGKSPRNMLNGWTGFDSSGSFAEAVAALAEAKFMEGLGEYFDAVVSNKTTSIWFESTFESKVLPLQLSIQLDEGSSSQRLFLFDLCDAVDDLLKWAESEEYSSHEEDRVLPNAEKISEALTLLAKRLEDGLADIRKAGVRSKVSKAKEKVSG